MPVFANEEAIIKNNAAKARHFTVSAQRIAGLEQYREFYVNIEQSNQIKTDSYFTLYINSTLLGARETYSTNMPQF